MNKKAFHSKTFILTVMSVFIVSIAGATLFTILQERGKNTKKFPDYSASPSTIPEPEHKNANEASMLAVIREIDTELFVIRLTDAQTGETDLYTYTGGADIRDRYDALLSARQLEQGEMADVVYDAVSKRILSLRISTEAFEYQGVKDLLFNTDEKTITILGKKYLYDDGILALDDGAAADMQGFRKSDVFTVRGYGHKVCAVILTRGHGYLKLIDADPFIGGNLYIGNIWEQVAADMVLSVPEGTYEVTIEFGAYKGTERVTIKKNQTTSFYAGGYGPPAVSKGRAYFTIFPEGASLYIDGVRTDYSGAVELSYGIHEIEAVLGGYQTHQGTISVDRAESRHTITLPQTSSGEKEEAGADDPPDAAGNGDEDGDVPAAGADAAGTDAAGTKIPDNTSDAGASNELAAVRNDSTLTISYIDGAEVYFDGIYVGEIAGGVLVLPKHAGSFDIDLYVEGRDLVSYAAEIEDDGQDITINIPY